MKLVLSFVLLSASLMAQTKSASVPKLFTGTTANIPATCIVGSVYFATDASAGQNLYLCTATNFWTQLTGTGGDAITSPNSTITVGGTSTNTTLDVAQILTGTPALGSLLVTNIAASSTPASGKTSVYVDSTSLNIAAKNASGIVNHGVQSIACTNQVLTAIANAGTSTCATVTSAYVNNTIAVTGGTDINISSQITGTNGLALPASAAVLSSNSSKQIIAAPLNNGTFWVGNASNLPVGVTPSGDLSMTNAGVFTVGRVNGVSLAGLGSGILYNTTGTGVLSIATVAQFPTLNQNTTGTAATITGAISITNTPFLTTNQDILYNFAGSLARLPLVSLGSCLGNPAGSWASISCGGGGGSGAFSAITGGTNTGAAMLVGTGASLGFTGSGTVAANNYGYGLGLAGGNLVLNTAVALAIPVEEAGKTKFLNSTNGTCAYTASLSASAALTGGYTKGQAFTVITDTPCASPTMNIDSQGTVSIKQANGTTNPAAGQIVAGVPFTITYNGTVFTLPPTFLPAGTQTQVLKIQPNTGNNTTTEWDSTAAAKITDYNFPAITPTGSPNITVGSNTLTIPLAPLGLNGTDTNHYIYISAGTGTAEAVPVTGGTCTELATACTLIFTAANTHSGAYNFTSATAGLQEAINHAGTAQTLYVPAGTYSMYAPAYIGPAGFVTIRGDGMFRSILQAQGAAVGIVDAVGPKNTFEDIGLTATVQQTSGGYGIRLGNGSSQESSFDRINRIYCEPLYDCVLAVNASQTEVTNSVFYNFTHTAVTANDTTNSDSDGPWIRGNVMFNSTLSAPALSCIYITSTGGITITDNNCYGSGLSPAQLQYNVYLNQTASTQVTIKGNVFETASVDSIEMTGVFNLIAITGNTIAQPQTSQNLWRGITINGNNTTSSCGSGIGICQISITGNTIQGPGSTSTSSVGIELIGFISGAFVGGNAINFSQIGVNIGTNVTLTTIGANQIQAYSQTLDGGSTGTTWLQSAPLLFSQLPTTANGSYLFVSDSNSTCTAGSSTGQWCKRLNGAWSN